MNTYTVCGVDDWLDRAIATEPPAAPLSAVSGDAVPSRMPLVDVVTCSERIGRTWMFPAGEVWSECPEGVPDVYLVHPVGERPASWVDVRRPELGTFDAWRWRFVDRLGVLFLVGWRIDRPWVVRSLKDEFAYLEDEAREWIAKEATAPAPAA